MSIRHPQLDAADSNFSFLAKHEPLFCQLGAGAERLFAFDPNASLLKLRQLGEAMAQSIAARLAIPFDDRTTQFDFLYAINRQISLETTVRELFHTLRIEGNRAAHEFTMTFKEAMDPIKVARQLAIWYHRANAQDQRETRADYVLFIGLSPVAAVEAKRFGNDVVDDLRQAEEYSRDIRLTSLEALHVADGEQTHGFIWPADAVGKHTFKVPFAFSTSGREFQHQPPRSDQTVFGTRNDEWKPKSAPLK